MSRVGHGKKGSRLVMSFRLFRLCWFFPLIIVLVACSTTESLGPQSMEGAMAGAPLGDYRLQSGDKIEIRLYNHPELNNTVVVGPDGKISLELVDEFLVAGLTSSQLDDLLTREYTRHLENVHITVIQREYVGTRAYVGGEVASPGFVHLKGTTSVLEAILARSGFKESAKPENVILLRKGPGSRPTAMVIDLGPVIAGAQLENDIYLMPADIVYVPKTAVAKAEKFVNEYVNNVLMLNSLIRGAGQALGWYWVRENVFETEN
ncbi:MAG: polysaccharide biosynthesis/export family protein [Thermodesulfobacteriota bacterium]|nr:polysaccharide biosynthesis/export family protein [Thermodesulfobacteriota bacterium]